MNSKRKHLSASFVYAFFFLIVGCWWYLAFASQPKQNENLLSFKPRRNSKPSYFSYLSPMAREDIQKALAGDEDKMLSLISEWDIDAQILIANHVKGIKRLSRRDYLRAQMFGRQRKLQLQCHDIEKILDDDGRTFYNDVEYQYILPQTYVSASFLLALIEPRRLVALPSGLRKDKHLFPLKTTNQVPLDIDRCNAESFFLSKPDLAFIAQYSNPNTIEALKRQNIPLFSINFLENLDQISDALKRVGVLTHASEKAQLLSIFMESAFAALDNRLLASQSTVAENNSFPRVMFLNYFAQFNVPTSRVISGQLLSRVKNRFQIYGIGLENVEDWSIPVGQENILTFNPDYLIISTLQGIPLENQILNNPIYSNVSAVKNERVFFVDQTVQESPTQYIVLAYYDLTRALQN